MYAKLYYLLHYINLPSTCHILKIIYFQKQTDQRTQTMAQKSEKTNHTTSNWYNTHRNETITL